MTPYAERPSSLWWTEFPAEPFAMLDRDLDVDVLVVGGGISGILLAWTLVERDARVAVVEAGAISGAASGRNAGFLVATPAEPYTEQVAMYGRPGAKAILDVGRRSHQRVRELAEALGIDCGYARRGSLKLARTEEEAEDLRASIKLLREDGFRIAEADVASSVPPHAVRHFRAAFVDPDDGEFDPVRFVRGVAAAAVQRGAALFERSRLLAAQWRDRVWEADVEGGHVRASILVLANNAYAPQLCPALEPLIRPRRGQMLATAPIAERVIARPTSAHWGYQYWRQTDDGRIVLGGWRDLDPDGEVGYEDQPTDRIQAGLESGLADLMPGPVAIERRWAGTMGFARDGRPLVGWLDAEHHLAIAAGYTGHGMSMAPACTLELADLLSWRPAPGITTFDPARFRELREMRAPVLALGVSERSA